LIWLIIQSCAELAVEVAAREPMGFTSQKKAKSQIIDGSYSQHRLLFIERRMEAGGMIC
jgi:hypothetical protein